MGKLSELVKNDRNYRIAVRFAMRGNRKELPILIELEDGERVWLKSLARKHDYDEFVFVCEGEVEVLSTDDEPISNRKVVTMNNKWKQFKIKVMDLCPDAFSQNEIRSLVGLPPRVGLDILPHTGEILHAKEDQSGLVSRKGEPGKQSMLLGIIADHPSTFSVNEIRAMIEFPVVEGGDVLYGTDKPLVIQTQD